MDPTALLVEDDTDWLRILRDELLGAGFKVDWATERDEALAKINAPPFPYEVLVVDPNLGDSLGGLSGALVVERAMRGESAPSIVLVSGYADVSTLVGEYDAYGTAVRGVFEKGDFELAVFRDLLLELRGVDRRQDALYRPNWRVLTKLWDALLTGSDDPNEQGHVLEDFAVELLQSIPLLELEETRAATSSGEVDAVFRVTATPGTLCQEWGGCLLVECRNRTERFDAPAVSAFLQKLLNADARVGIVISKSGVTERGLSHARRQIAQAYLLHKRVIIELDGDDLVAVLDQGANLYGLLREKDLAVRLGR